MRGGVSWAFLNAWFILKIGVSERKRENAVGEIVEFYFDAIIFWRRAKLVNPWRYFDGYIYAGH